MATQTATRGGSSGPVGTVSEDGEVTTAAAAGKTAAGKTATAKKGKPVKGDKEAKGGKKKIIIILIAVLVVGFVGYKMLGPKPKPGKPTPPKPGVVVAMTDTTLNLTDGHFLKVKLGLQTVVGAPADLDTSKASDLLISEFTGQDMATLSTATGRNKLKEDLLQKIEVAYPKQIMGLYFTEFVMQ